LHNCFYTSSLNHRATSNFPGQPKPSFHYIQKFYKSNTKIRLLNKEQHKIFYSHKNVDNYPARITLTNLKLHKATNQRHKNIQTWW